MKSEDVDKLFKERLGNTSPTPSADLWNRLQSRMEEEMPTREEKKPIMMWARTYAVAAAVTVLLSAGVVFYNVQQEVDAPADNLAQVDTKEVNAAKPLDSDNWTSRSIAVAPEEENDVAGEDIVKESIAQADVPAEEPAVTSQPQKAVRQPEKKQPVRPEQNRTMLAASEIKQVQPDPEPVKITMPETPVSFASAKSDMNTAPVEIIIKRTVATQTIEAALEEDEPVSDFQKKRTLAKNIFKQVKNLSNGEQVDLSELGVNANRIALETQIGKQKISKVINL